MTIRDILVLVEQRFSIFSEPIDDARLQDILDGATLYERDWSARPDIDALSDILIEYDSNRPFDIRQLDKKLQEGFHVYWDVIHFDDIVISYFQDKISAFKYYRTLTPDILTCKKALIDTTKGILVAEKLTGGEIERSQYLLFKAWKQKKCATDPPSDVPAGGPIMEKGGLWHETFSGHSGNH